MRFPAKITSSCIWVAIPVDWVILHWYACGEDGRSLRRAMYGHVVTKFFRMGRLLHFLTHGAPLARFAHESFGINLSLKRGFHMIVRIVSNVPVVSKMFRRSGRSYGNAHQTIAKEPDDWDDLDRLNRIEFYPKDRDDHVTFEAIKWKRSQTTETIGTIEGYSRSHHFDSSNRE